MGNKEAKSIDELLKEQDQPASDTHEAKKSEKIDLKKLIIYSEIMKPKFEE